MYLLECRDGTLYAGSTADLGRRLEEHNAGRGARYTRGRTPVRVVWSEDLPDRSTALRREWELKRLRRAAKLRLVRGER